MPGMQYCICIVTHNELDYTVFLVSFAFELGPVGL